MEHLGSAPRVDEEIDWGGGTSCTPLRRKMLRFSDRPLATASQSEFSLRVRAPRARSRARATKRAARASGRRKGQKGKVFFSQKTPGSRREPRKNGSISCWLPLKRPSRRLSTCVLLTMRVGVQLIYLRRSWLHFSFQHPKRKLVFSWVKRRFFLTSGMVHLGSYGWTQS